MAMGMAISVSVALQLLLLSLVLLSCQFSYSSADAKNNSVIKQGSSLSVENPQDALVSPNGFFSAGFYPVGDNAYCFSIWFTDQNQTLAVVWMANRDQPVNGKRSTLSLLNNANLVLMDAGQSSIWSTATTSSSSVHLILDDSGNLLLREIEGGLVLWQSFDFPTDTLLPQQFLTRYTKLVSSRSSTNYSSGFYQLFFDNDNLLRLLYNGPEISSVYWPDPWLVSWQAGRSTYNNSRVAVLNSLGNFSSSDDFTFMTSDYGTVLHRRLKMDDDGNIRVYSRSREGEEWSVTWQANLTPCRIHGICGPNSICTYSPNSGRTCSCLPGYSMKNHTDWSSGCEPRFELSCKISHFLFLDHTEFYGYDYGFYPNYTFIQCKEFCLQLCNCKGFQYSFSSGSGVYDCYPKLQLLNGYRSPNFFGSTYLRVPEESSSSSIEDVKKSIEEYSLACSANLETIQVERTYEKGHVNGSVKFMLWFATGLGGLEILCIFLVWCFLIRNKQRSGADTHGYALTATNEFRRFTHSELKAATKGFSQEIGSGSGGVVYKGLLSDQRVVAIKRLREGTQYGEGEFLAEVSSLGRLNHMNLIKMWGYCAEGKHRLLVYEYAEHGSLAENIRSNELDWSQRFNIALDTARGLAYLHEECLEWVLHCDVKPQNILLDSNYQPKVADFGLSKLLNRNAVKHSSFSRIRGTRGYMAPEWVLNLPITSKVDVYSYGIVVLEMLTGRSASATMEDMDGVVETHHPRLVTWVREKFSKGAAMSLPWVPEIVDPAIERDYDVGKMQVLARVALQCVEEERNKRPTMRQVVEKLSEFKDETEPSQR